MSSMATDTETPFSQNIVRGIFEGLKYQKDSSDFADVQVVIGDSEFKCHRVILAACSDFFKALLTSGMKEDLERRVKLKEISRETFSDILDCIYTGKNILDEQNMFEIWHAAHHLQILFLLNECEMFLKQKISIKNCLAIYQSSKLLDSTEMTQFSWSYLLQKFEPVRRCEEIVMLTDKEMKKLIESQDLKTNSEDGVLETILQWVAYKPIEAASRTDYSDETFEAVRECANNSKDSNPQDQEKLAEVTQTSHREQDVCASADRQQHENECKNKTVSRSDHLCDLLKVTRICLLSGKCLMEALRNDHIRAADKRAKEILEEGFEYLLRMDRRHDFCPPSAIHRSCSHMENVIVAVKAGSHPDILVCRKQDGQWYGLGNPLSRHDTLSPSAICFNNNVYVSVEDQLFVYMTSLNQWRELPELTLAGEVTNILSVGNFLYAVHNEVSHSVEMINLAETSGASPGGQWIKVLKLTLKSMNIICTTTVGDKIIFFGNVGKAARKLLIFDTVTLTCSMFNDVSSASSRAVSFSKGKESFILHENGALYRIRECSGYPFIELKYETMLWDFQRTLKGAVLFNDELLLFGPSFSTSDSDKQWALSIQGVFKCVKNIACNKKYSCFTHTVIPKAYFSGSTSVLKCVSVV